MADTALQTVTRLLDKWWTSRTQLAALEQTEHPDLTDHHGRTWTWWKGNLYRHCGMAWPKEFITNSRHGLPRKTVLVNPNYPVMCSICDPNRMSETRQT